jgi:hypothetical protein
MFPESPLGRVKALMNKVRIALLRVNYGTNNKKIIKNDDLFLFTAKKFSNYRNFSQWI